MSLESLNNEVQRKVKNNQSRALNVVRLVGLQSFRHINEHFTEKHLNICLGFKATVDASP